MNIFDSPGLMGLTGIPVHISPAIPATRPKIEISHSFEWITDEARARINADLLNWFGSEPVVYRMGNMILANPITVQALRGMGALP